MSYYIIIRGPLGCGKSTIAETLSKKLKAKHFAIDRVLEDYNIEEWENGYVSIKSFIKANEISAEKAKKDLEKGIPVIFDGNFYFKEQIENLIKRLNFPHQVFTLKAPLHVCIDRDSKRAKTHGKDAAEAVYKKSTSFDYGIGIDVNKSKKETIEEILSLINNKKRKKK
jgi:tRNA uridine 5-carbamoylmethylation protein Kti12